MENKLEIIVKESGLEKSKAQVLLENFSNYFEIAAEWETKAKAIRVTDESQRTEMKMAREGRLFLKQKRVDVENTRKQLKEQSLREGQTIDAIAKILKNLIEPIEEDLEKQEKFIEIRDAERKALRKEERVKILTALDFDFSYTDLLNMDDASFDGLVLKLENEISARKEAERKAEEERIEKERAEAEERERIRIENERLKAEAEERERVAEIERKKAAEELAKAEAERKAVEEQARKEREEAERLRIESERMASAKLEAERKERERVEAELKSKQDAEKKEETDRIASEKKAAAAPDKQKLLALANAFNQIHMPELATSEAVEILNNITELQGRLIKFITDKANTL